MVSFIQNSNLTGHHVFLCSVSWPDQMMTKPTLALFDNHVVTSHTILAGPPLSAPLQLFQVTRRLSGRDNHQSTEGRTRSLRNPGRQTGSVWRASLSEVSRWNQEPWGHPSFGKYKREKHGAKSCLKRSQREDTPRI